MQLIVVVVEKSAAPERAVGPAQCTQDAVKADERLARLVVKELPVEGTLELPIAGYATQRYAPRTSGANTARA